MEDITNIPERIPVTPEGHKSSKKHHKKNEVESSPTSPGKISLTPSPSRILKAKLRNSPRLQRTLTPIRRTATTLAFQILTTPTRKASSFIRSNRSTTDLSSTSSSTSLSTPRKNETPLWRNTVDESVLNSLSKSELKRQELIFELIVTEEIYLKDLYVISELFITPLSNMSSVSHQDLEKIFGRIPEVIEICEDFLGQLREKQSQYPNLIIEKIGDVIKSKFEDFICYGQYIGDLTSAKNHLSILSQKSEVEKLLKENLSKEECRRLDLLNFLDQPRRRLAKYSCLIHEIGKYTPQDHPDKQDITSAVTIMDEVLEKIDHEAGILVKEFQLNNMKEYLLKKVEKDESTELINKASEIVHEDSVKHKEGKDLSLFLLDTCLVMSRVTNKSGIMKYKLFREPISLKDIEVLDLKDVVDGNSKNLEAVSVDPLAFRVTHIGEKKNYVLTANSMSSKSKWIDLLSKKSR